jgi:hypothetical protein
MQFLMTAAHSSGLGIDRIFAPWHYQNQRLHHGRSKLLLHLFFRRLQLTTVDLADFLAGGVRSESFFQVVGAEVMDGLMANFYYPGLGVWRSIFLLISKAIEEFLGGGHVSSGHMMKFNAHLFR